MSITTKESERPLVKPAWFWNVLFGIAYAIQSMKKIFTGQLSHGDSKAISGNASGILFISVVVIIALYYGVSSFFCWAVNYCS